MINKKDLILKLRSDYYLKIRPLYIKDKCENCGYEENLELHHSKPFIDQLKQCLQELNLDNLIFTDSEVNSIRNYMLGSQIRNSNITLCSNCHISHHKINSNRIYLKKHSNTSDNYSIHTNISSDIVKLPVNMYDLIVKNKSFDANSIFLYCFVLNNFSFKTITIKDLLNFTYESYTLPICNRNIYSAVNKLLKLNLINKNEKVGANNTFFTMSTKIELTEEVQFILNQMLSTMY